jgi:UDP-N-acetylmuramoyl-L-alanyl-D-glutamate--2,6-diaminopimelate ligase
VPATIEDRFAAALRRLTTVATTGTNGKTTTTSMVASIVAASGEPSARLTTVGGEVSGRAIEAPDLPSLFLATVEEAVAAGVRTLALEVTSMALAGGFAARWPPSVAVFTNITRDHLDLHGSPEAYLAAKAQLFMALRDGGTAVLNGDDPASALVREVISPGVRVVTFSTRTEATLRATSVRSREDGLLVSLADGPLARALGGGLSLGARGEVHARNALAAALAADAAGYGPEAIREGLARFVAVAGRFEVISRDPMVVVDYAHTPDALDATLASARALCRGDLHCVFGCGGDRDEGKRPLMGAVVDALADVAWLTSDNPRSEDPEAIMDAVLTGVSIPRARWVREVDRARAIAGAIASANPEDVVLVAGKGHERTQEIRGQEIPFDDAAVARAALARRASGD